MARGRKYGTTNKPRGKLTREGVNLTRSEWAWTVPETLSSGVFAFHRLERSLRHCLFFVSPAMRLLAAGAREDRAPPPRQLWNVSQPQRGGLRSVGRTVAHRQREALRNGKSSEYVVESATGSALTAHVSLVGRSRALKRLESPRMRSVRFFRLCLPAEPASVWLTCPPGKLGTGD